MRLIGVFLILAAGCGYRWQPDFPTEQRPIIAVPFIEGDTDGTLTSEVIRAITASGVAQVRSGEGDFRLQIAIGESQVQTVGYRRDRQKVSGEIKKNIVACEGRKTLSVKATLYRGSTEEIAYGPYSVAADADYDYIDGDSLQDLTFVDSAGRVITVLPFSLGQLEPMESAQEAASRPLNVKLARKIVDAIFSEWY